MTGLIFGIVGGAGFGFVLARVFWTIQLKKTQGVLNAQRNIIIQQAQLKADAFKKEQLSRLENQIEAEREDLAELYTGRMSDLEGLDADLDQREESLQKQNDTLRKHESELQSLRDKLKNSQSRIVLISEEMQKEQSQLHDALAKVAKIDPVKTRDQLIEERIQQKTLESNKMLKLLSEELNTSSQRLASRILSRVHSRYVPDFVWPKSLNHIDLSESPQLVEQITAMNLLGTLQELTEHVNIQFDGVDDGRPMIRFGGGYGIYREAAKLSLIELLKHPQKEWGKIESFYQRHRQKLEHEAAELGKRAFKELQLNPMHMEILKMVGSLNWRTSYRQNQYHHSVEVSKIAGVVAAELGVDQEAAKRCGLLHDIGKSIDYRIEGSHAVISGDYADRYGESKLICDTVMSHHADLIVETPLAWVLMTADTLSGARPGARVNLEEGYKDRLSSIHDVVKAFPGVSKVEIMSGAREVHIEVHHKHISESDIDQLSQAIARKIEENVAFPGQIRIQVTRRFEAVAVA
jgi:ribonucrease Y